MMSVAQRSSGHFRKWRSIASSFVSPGLFQITIVRRGLRRLAICSTRLLSLSICVRVTKIASRCHYDASDEANPGILIVWMVSQMPLDKLFGCLFFTWLHNSPNPDLAARCQALCQLLNA
jgi:hypothetical protein